MTVADTPTKEPFCPLYKSVVDGEPWKKSASPHCGLLFDKFAHGWRYKVERSQPTFPEFDKGVGRNKDGANDWLNSFNRAVGAPALLTEACARQRRLVARLGGEVLLLTNTSRFVTGMGRQF